MTLAILAICCLLCFVAGFALGGMFEAARAARYDKKQPPQGGGTP